MSMELAINLDLLHRLDLHHLDLDLYDLYEVLALVL